MPHVNRIQNIKMGLHMIMNRALFVQVFTGYNHRSDKNTCVDFHFQDEKGNGYTMLLSQIDKSITATSEDTSGIIAEQSILNTDTHEISLGKRTDNSFIETVVTLGRTLYEALLPGSRDKMYFTKLYIKEHMDDKPYQTIKIRNNPKSNRRLRGLLIVKATIEVDGQETGYVSGAAIVQNTPGLKEKINTAISA